MRCSRSKRGRWPCALIALLPPGLAWPAAANPVKGILDNVDALVGLFLMGGILVGAFLIILGVQGIRTNHYRPNSYPVGNIAACLIVGALLISPWFLYELITDSVDLRQLVPENQRKNTFQTLPDGQHPLAIEARVEGYTPSPGSYFGQFITSHGLKYLVILINLLGVFFFLKGIYCWRYAGQPNKPQGFDRPVAKGVTHILGAILLINLMDVGCGMSLIFGSTMFCDAP